MRKKTAKRAARQALEGLSEGIRQALMPMVAGIAATKTDVMAWVHQTGLAALQEVFALDAESVAGRKGKHQTDRRIHHWGHSAAELTFGGRRITVDRPRLRSTAGKEVQLPVLSDFRAMDPLQARVLNQVLLGVSTRGYERSLEAAPTAKSRGTSKSAASRHLVSRMGARMRDHLMRKLDDIQVKALVMDGVLVARHTVVVALGILADGTKVPLGLWQGSTENAAVCTSLLQDVLSRGLRIEGRVLCVIDGGKGLRKAITDVFGEATLVQRCQIHKRRNVREHLPKSRQKHVDAVMRQAYMSGSADTARKQLRTLAASLEAEGHDGAAASVREGLEETLTVLKLRLPATLARSFATTNCIESLLSTVRRVARNVKRWRGGDMVKRWTAAGVLAAADRFRRVKGYREMNALCAALTETRIDEKGEAA